MLERIHSVAISRMFPFPFFTSSVSVPCPFHFRSISVSSSLTHSVSILYPFAFTVPVRFLLSGTVIFLWHFGTPRSHRLFSQFIILIFDFTYYVFRILIDLKKMLLIMQDMTPKTANLTTPVMLQNHKPHPLHPRDHQPQL